MRVKKMRSKETKEERDAGETPMVNIIPVLFVAE